MEDQKRLAEGRCRAVLLTASENTTKTLSLAPQLLRQGRRWRIERVSTTLTEG